MPNPDDSNDSCRWILALGVVVAVVVFCVPLLLGVPLFDPDEGLLASIAQEMVERGDWLTPRLLGQPFLDKPILYFWAQAVSLRLFGMHEAAVRLPGLLLGLLGAVTAGAVGWRMFGRSVGLLAGVSYGSMILPSALAQAAVHDVALIPCINLALLLWESERAAGWRTGLRYVPAIGLLLGLTCLTKGLVGVASVGVAYGSYLLVSRRLSCAVCIRGAAALAVAAAIAAVWFLPTGIHNPGYLRYYFVDRHLLGFATDTQRHGGGPWWYYLPILLGGGLPWIAYVPAVVVERWTAGRAGQVTTAGTAGPTGAAEAAGHGDGAMVLLWCWLIGCTLLLSASRSKLVTYIWPVLPAVAILAAVVWVRLLRGTLGRHARRWILSMFWLMGLCGVAFLPAAVLVAQSKLDARFGPAVWTATVLAGLSCWLPLMFAYRVQLRAALSLQILAMLGQYLVVMTVVIPHFAAAASARDLAEHFNRTGRVPPRVLVVEERIGSLIFYLDPGLRAGLRRCQFESIQLRPWTRVPRPMAGSVVAVPESEASEAAGYFQFDAVSYQRAGRYRVYEAEELESEILVADVSGNDTARR